MYTRGFALVVIFLIGALVLVVGGTWFYLVHQSNNSQARSHSQVTNSAQNAPSFDAQKADPVIQDAIQQYSSSSQLYVVPTSISIPPVAASKYPSFSYDGMVFNVPWRDHFTIQVSQPNKSLTFLHFPNNKIIEVFASSSSISPIAGGALSSYLSGVAQSGPYSSAAWEEFYGSALQSNYNFISASLDSSPDQLSIDNAKIAESILAATGLLRTKSEIFESLENDLLPTQNISAINDFSNSTVKGFEFIGVAPSGTTTQNVAHFLFFDAEDQPFNLLIMGATQDEDNFILSTLKS